jgi:hypothetical protein
MHNTAHSVWLPLCNAQHCAQCQPHTAHVLIFYFLLNFSNLFPKKKKQESEEQWRRERDIYLAAREHHWLEGFPGFARLSFW